MSHVTINVPKFTHRKMRRKVRHIHSDKKFLQLRLFRSSDWLSLPWPFKNLFLHAINQLPFFPIHHPPLSANQNLNRRKHIGIPLESRPQNRESTQNLRKKEQTRRKNDVLLAFDPAGEEGCEDTGELPKSSERKTW